jgi:hypothetical protein
MTGDLRTCNPDQRRYMDRSTFLKQLLATVSGFALMETLLTMDAVGKPIRPITDHWALQLHTYCADLRQASITPAEWQRLVGELYARIELEEILRFIDFDTLRKGFDYPDLGVNTRPVKFPVLAGLPEKTVFVKKVFGMQRDRAIIPHGHSNMASAHLVLQGALHLRHYEKVHQDAGHMVIRPSIDRIAQRGQSSSISDEQDNVHWFIAQTPTAFTFDVIMLDLGGQAYDIHNLDIFAQQDLHDGTLRVPILDVEVALKKYGKAHH